MAVRITWPGASVQYDTPDQVVCLAENLERLSPCPRRNLRHRPADDRLGNVCARDRSWVQ
eukprot:12883012-Prorocentrum_lima.AAC.1